VAAAIERDFPADQADAARTFELKFAIPALLRELMSMWGADALVLWRDGLCFFDLSAGSRAMVEIVRFERSWKAEVRMKTWGENAPVLLDRLTAKVLEVAKRFDSDVEELESAIRDESGSDTLENMPRIVPGPPPTAKDQCFISYRSAAASALSAVKARLEELNIEPYCDERELRNGDSIRAFMLRAAVQSAKFVLLIPPNYFDSEFTAAELLHIWHVCGADKETFQSKVRIVLLDGADIGVQNRRTIERQWDENFKAAQQELAAVGMNKSSSPANDRRELAWNLQGSIGAILAAIADSKYIEGIENISQLTFDNHP
jgi:hypothetical protein